MPNNEAANAAQETALAVPAQEENKRMSVLNDETDIAGQLTNHQADYCSFNAVTPEQKAVLFTAMNNPQFRLADKINETVDVKDVYAEILHITDEQTGEITTCPRVVLIDPKGESYQAVSLGIYGAIKRLFKAFGEPGTWEKPLRIKVRSISKGDRKMLTFDVLGFAPGK